MSGFSVPIKKPKPDFEGFLDAIGGKRVPSRPPMVEYLIDNAVMMPILKDMLGRTWVDTPDKTEYMGGQMDFSEENLLTVNAWLDNQIAFWYHMGYDFVRVEVSLPLPAISHITEDTARGWENHNRAWQGLEPGMIQTMKDFYEYPWPEIHDDNFYIHRYICDHIFEYNKRLLELEGVSAIFQGEDLGFNTQTLVSPDDIRTFFLPWLKKYASQTHEKGRAYSIHSCGKVDELMEDFI